MSIEEIDASAGLWGFQKDDESVIVNRTLKTNYSTQGNFRAENSTLEGKIEARDGMILNQVISLKEVKCSMGTIEAEYSQLEKVKARDGAELTETDAKHVEVSMGKLTWTNSQTKVPASSISARDGMHLKGVHCEGDTTCSMGKIKAQNSIFNNITSRDGMHLTECQAQEATVEMGSLEAKNCQFVATNARDGMTLVDSPAESCNVSMGSLKITAQGPSLTYKQISGRDGVSLTNIQATDSVESVLGNLYAKDCRLSSILASQQIELVRTTAESACLHVSKSGTVILNVSTIEGDLVIEESKNIIINSGFISGTIYINGQPYNPNQSTSTKTLEIKIYGGTIKGNIIFRNCQGSVKLLDGAQVAGKVN